jgi:hypothetical protein
MVEHKINIYVLVLNKQVAFLHVSVMNKGLIMFLTKECFSPCLRASVPLW